ncbi:hypothetical protein B0H11DRAFT_49307 [Mycena galericulata]|nr:hypothetical protein B0H11DRAFT_49307 [Mycena galericulata]
MPFTTGGAPQGDFFVRPSGPAKCAPLVAEHDQVPVVPALEFIPDSCWRREAVTSPTRIHWACGCGRDEMAWRIVRMEYGRVCSRPGIAPTADHGKGNSSFPAWVRVSMPARRGGDYANQCHALVGGSRAAPDSTSTSLPLDGLIPAGQKNTSGAQTGRVRHIKKISSPSYCHLPRIQRPGKKHGPAPKRGGGIHSTAGQHATGVAGDRYQCPRLVVDSMDYRENRSRGRSMSPFNTT